MDKIKALLEQLGGSKELTTQIVESLEQFKVKAEDKIKGDYQERLGKAKDACLEEVKAYKVELARKAQIFFESKVEKIEQQIAKQVAVKDSAAESKLEAIAALLEGIGANSEGDNAEVQAAQKQIKELQEGLNKATGKVKILTSQAKRSYAIAEKTLERNKVLSTELVETKKPKAKAKPVTESKKTKGKGKAKPKAKKALTEGRKKSKPATSRKSKVDQIAKTAKKDGTPTPTGGFNPLSIAADMPEIL
jgi:hypothetical protein